MKRPEKSLSAVARAERELRKLIAGQSDGAFLGSEEQLLILLGVSRPTFRQVAKLLERDHLLDIRRGVGGGFYSRKPSIEGVARSAAVYLESEKATLRNAMLAVAQLSREMIRLAAQDKDEERRSALLEMIASDQAAANLPCAPEVFVASEIAFVDLLSAMCGNPVIRLFVSILYGFAGAPIGAVMYQRDERIHWARTARIQCAEAILARDAELASLLFRRRAETQHGWLKTDFGESVMETALLGNTWS